MSVNDMRIGMLEQLAVYLMPFAISPSPGTGTAKRNRPMGQWSWSNLGILFPNQQPFASMGHGERSAIWRSRG